MNWYIYALKNGFNFNGLANREEYWSFLLYHFYFGLMAFTTDAFIKYAGTWHINYHICLISYVSLLFFPTLALSIRRLNDLDKNWKWVFILLLPVFGQIWLWVLFTHKGKNSRTAYETPKNPINRDVVLTIAIIITAIYATFWSTLTNAVPQEYMKLTIALEVIQGYTIVSIPVFLTTIIKSNKTRIKLMALIAVYLLYCLIDGLIA